MRTLCAEQQRILEKRNPAPQPPSKRRRTSVDSDNEYADMVQDDAGGSPLDEVDQFLLTVAGDSKAKKMNSKDILGWWKEKVCFKLKPRCS